MKYKVKVSKTFIRQFSKLDRQVQNMVDTWIKKHIYNCEDPRAFGKPLENEFSGYWRYRIGDYRLIVEIKDKEAIIFMIKIGHRKEVYK